MPKGPPKKKLKQADLLSFFQQSRVGQEKQTGRDDKSGETSHNAQKTTAPSVKKEVEAGPSKDLQQEVEENTHTFQFCLNSETLTVVCKTSMTVLEALNTSKIFRDEKNKQQNKQKEILIQRPNGKVPSAAVKTDFPCCLIEEDEILDITFIQKDGNSSTNQQTTADPSLLSKRSKPEKFVTFCVKKGGGPTVTCLLKSKALRRRVSYVCVFAFKGEKIKTALKRDGRFNDVIFRKTCGLYEFGMDKKHEFSIPVDYLDRKAFQVVVISKKNQPESQEDDATLVKTVPNEASDADAVENAGPSQNPVNTEQEKKQDGNTTKSTNPSKRYVAKLIDNSEEIAKILRDQCEDLLETVKQREKLKNKSQVLKFFREEYHKSVENFLEVKKVKQLMRLSDSVCRIRFRGETVGTGFLLFDRFILTNAHVIVKTAPLSTHFKEYKVEFDYKGKDSIKRISVKQHAICVYEKIDRGRYLDYALLELVSVKKIAQYPKLLRCYSPNPPNRGQICILGYPGEGVKKMDPCIIIERENRQEAANKHASENEHLIHVMMKVYEEQKWDFSSYENKFTYNSCFFHGSSGSPVFDVNCNLIGVHTGGYVYKVEGWSVMDYGFTMQPILESISAQAKINSLHEIVNALEPYVTKSNVSVDQHNQTDFEMKDAEKS
ncbi:serine protease FAM111A-like [Pimephales promelas]|uniref:serine protease FAM111A-like n=1 Tax=Pimephales promelas TaxID=90988 RepID=UPI001955EE28|nr:serine protease FAM111A-like [Pimephales promelas]KAG1944000.1 protein FAM111A [Pimephales promelas]